MTDGIGSRLRDIRRHWDINQDELAKRAGVSVATIRRMENGYYSPRLSTAQKLADAVQIRVEWLLTGSEPMLHLGHLTGDEQVRVQGGREHAGLPELDVVEDGVWYRDESGRWQVARRAEG
jgi:DNA-binding XRE family transcriptional regulator